MKNSLVKCCFVSVISLTAIGLYKGLILDKIQLIEETNNNKVSNDTKINLLVNKFYNIVENTKSYKKIFWQDGQGGEFRGSEEENFEKDYFFETYLICFIRLKFG